MKKEFINFEANDVDQDQHENDKELDLLAEIDDFIDDESVQEESEEHVFIGLSTRPVTLMKP